MMQVEDRIIVQARRAAKSALIVWFSGQWTRQAEAIGDLHQELLAWYMTEKSTQIKMGKLSDPEIMMMFRMRAGQLLSRQSLDSDVFDGKVLYSSDTIKDALKNSTDNKYLISVLPIAISRLSVTHQEAINERYNSKEKLSPTTDEGKNALRRAHYALCRNVNMIYITADKENRHEIFPDTIKPKGDHGDPTAGIALTLMEQHPDVKDEYLYESPWEQINQGAAAEPVIEFGPSGRYRLTAEEAKLFRRVPGLIELFIEQKQKEWSNV